MENCVLIKNNKKTKGKVTQVIFYLSENTETSFRCYATYYSVKFYEYDAIKNQPGSLLSYFPHIIHPKGNKKEKIIIDLNEHHVLFPQKGICVGIETVNPLPKRKINKFHTTFPSLLGRMMMSLCQGIVLEVNLGFSKNIQENQKVSFIKEGIIFITQL